MWCQSQPRIIAVRCGCLCSMTRYARTHFNLFFIICYHFSYAHLFFPLYFISAFFCRVSYNFNFYHYHVAMLLWLFRFFSFEHLLIFVIFNQSIFDLFNVVFFILILFFTFFMLILFFANCIPHCIGYQSPWRIHSGSAVRHENIRRWTAVRTDMFWCPIQNPFIPSKKVTFHYIFSLYLFIISFHYIFSLYQFIKSIHCINSLYLFIISIHYINSLYQFIISFHYIFSYFSLVLVRTLFSWFTV